MFFANKEPMCMNYRGNTDCGVLGGPFQGGIRFIYGYTGILFFEMIRGHIGYIGTFSEGGGGYIGFSAQA